MQDDYDPEAPSDFDLDDQDETLACPECGAAVYDDADYCNKCGHWITPSDSQSKLDLKHPHRNTKLIALILLLVILVPAIVFWVVTFLI